MKKLFPLLLALLLFLCGCSQPEASPAMYIEPAQLTEEEQAIADLLGANTQQLIYDFVVDETVQRMSVSAYELIDGQWQPFIGGPDSGIAFTDTKGRIALDFDRLEEGLREAIQSENYKGSTAWSAEIDDSPAGTSWATSHLSQTTEITYEVEVPLAIQIVTSKNEIRSFDPDYYFHPEEYASMGYDHVYAITVLFSQEPLS